MYVDTQLGISSIRGARVGDTVYGSGIPAGTQIADITNNGRVILSNDLTTPTRPVGRYRRYTGVQKSQRTINKAYYGYSGDSLIDDNHDVHVIDNFSTGKKENCNNRAVYHELDLADFSISLYSL